MRVHRFYKGNYDNLRSDIASFASTIMSSTLRNNAFEENWSVVSGDKYIPHLITKGKIPI